jgi:hypothetical protein
VSNLGSIAKENTMDAIGLLIVLAGVGFAVLVAAIAQLIENWIENWLDRKEKKVVAEDDLDIDLYLDIADPYGDAETAKDAVLNWA